MFRCAGDPGAEGADEIVDVRLAHFDVVPETVPDAGDVDSKRLAMIERLRMPSFTILRVKSMVLARVGQVLVIVGVRAAGVPAASRLFVVALRRRLDRVEVAVACGRCSSLARWRILARGLVGVVADDE